MDTPIKEYPFSSSASSGLGTRLGWNVCLLLWECLAMSSNETEDIVNRYLSELHKAIASPASLAVDLFTVGVIPRKVYNDAISHDGSITTEQKIHAICDALVQSVVIKPALLVEFVDVAEDNSPAMNDVCARIKREPLYSEFSTACSHILFGPFLSDIWA